jgi:hypothetical protein
MRWLADTVMTLLALVVKSEGRFILVSVMVMNISFAIRYKTGLFVALLSLPVTFFPYIAVSLLNIGMIRLHNYAQDRIGRLQTIFWAFFAFLLVGVVIFLLSLVYPMSLLFSWLGLEPLVPPYWHWAANLGIGVAIILWLRCSFRNFLPEPSHD